jgi:hypothetical protein
MGVSILFFIVGMIVLFYHLVADLSLRLKWGALPLSIGIMYAASLLVTGMSFLMFREGAFIMLDAGVVVAIGLLHVDIGRRLERLASED